MHKKREKETGWRCNTFFWKIGMNDRNAVVFRRQCKRGDFPVTWLGKSTSGININILLFPIRLFKLL